jgi:hypothetical protein
MVSVFWLFLTCREEKVWPLRFLSWLFSTGPRHWFWSKLDPSVSGGAWTFQGVVLWLALANGGRAERTSVWLATFLSPCLLHLGAFGKMAALALSSFWEQSLLGRNEPGAGHTRICYPSNSVTVTGVHVEAAQCQALRTQRWPVSQSPYSAKENLYARQKETQERTRDNQNSHRNNQDWEKVASSPSFF